ncbi:CotH kinase family protein, partial [Planctomycetota bacterium]
MPEEWGYFDDQGPARPARAKANYATDPDIANHDDYKDTLRDDLRAVPTVSLVVDPEDLWPLETGIYSNSELKGDRWERPASAEWLNVDGETEWTTNAGIRIHGGWARRPSQTLKFSFKVIFRGEYGDSNLVHPIFGEDGQQEFQSIIMRGGFNDSWRSSGNGNNTYTQDQWTRATQREMGGHTSQDRYVHLYLNGLYWGMYSATERMNAEWASAYMGGEPEEWDVINTGGNVIDGNARGFNDLMRLASNDNTTYEELAAAVEIDDYIDYMLVNQYVGNWDWPHNNWYASHRRVDGAKWQFHTWDAEAAFQRGISEDRVHVDRNEVGPGRVYFALVKHPEFQERYAEKAYEHLFNGGTLSPEAATERLRAIAEGMDRAIVGESLRWGDGKDNSGRALTRDNWTRRIEAIIRTHFPRRGERYIAQLRDGSGAPLVAPLYSLIDGPTYNQFGGKVTPDFDIKITTDLVGGTVYYTDDGTDPRTADGSLSESAIRLTSAQLVGPSSSAKILVPTGAATEANWQTADFDDSQWAEGTATVGYESGILDDPMAVSGGFTVTQYNFPDRPNSLADVDSWLSTNAFDSEKTINVPYVNFLDGRRGGNFSDNDLDFPSGGNNFASKATGTITVKDAGEYTFLVTSNDAARLTIDGNVLHNDEGRHGTEDALVTVTLEAGDHPVELLHFDRTGTGVLEFSFSQGAKTEHDETFQLVGNGGHRDFSPIVQTDLKDELLNKSATAYLRIPFDVDAPDNVGNLLLRAQYGDGFAAYINGTLVASANAPDSLTHESVSTANRFDADAATFELFDITEHTGLLKAGENILAIQALNNAADDLDMLFSPDLFMTLAEAPIRVAESTDINARVFLNGEWSMNTKAAFRVSDPATSDNLRVSEINYHPSFATESEIAAGYTDADDFEFIEIVNVSDKAVDLSDVSLSKIVVQQNTEGVGFDFADGNIVEIGPGEHVLVVEDILAFETRYGTGLPVAGQWSGSLGNASETISLVAGDSVVQRFEYDDTWHGLTDGRGSTLEVYSPA